MLLLERVGFLVTHYLIIFPQKKLTLRLCHVHFSGHPFFMSNDISSASDIGDFICSMPDNLQILYMAGSPNLGLAEQDPLQDLLDHQNELNAFLKILVPSA